MTASELRDKYEQLKRVTEGLPSASADKVIISAMDELAYVYLKSGNTTLPRELYNQVAQYLNVRGEVTVGDRVEEQCKEESASYEEELRYMVDDMVYVSEKPTELCATLEACKPYMPSDILHSRNFIKFSNEWEKGVQPEAFWSYTWSYTMDIEYLNSIRNKYPKEYEAFKLACSECYKHRGYYRIRKKIDKVWRRYNEMSESMKEKVIRIQFVKRDAKLIGSGEKRTYERFVVDIVD